MSIRSSRITQDFAKLKRMLKQGTIIQLKPFNPKKKSIDHLAILIKGPKGTAYAGGLFKLEMRFPIQ
jgi:ubiquitin-protein ligase